MSSFADNQYSQFTDLSHILHSHNISTIVVTGLATDYCVKFTAIDGRKFGFNVIVLKDAMRPVEPADAEKTFSEMAQWECRITDSQSYLREL